MVPVEHLGRPRVKKVPVEHLGEPSQVYHGSERVSSCLSVCPYLETNTIPTIKNRPNVYYSCVGVNSGEVKETPRLPLEEINEMRLKDHQTNNEESFLDSSEVTLDTEMQIGPNQENENEFVVYGCRIIDFMYVFEQLKEISHHNSPFECNFSNLKLTKEIKKGFISKFSFICDMCNAHLTLQNCKNKEKEELNLNENVVSSFMSIGTGLTGLQEVSASLNIPYMSNKLYAKCHAWVCELWELAKEKCMEEAAKEEYDLAVENGDVDENGVPMITVVADACWAKWSYRKNYNALSGAAVIIGYRTKKVLYMAVKNKYCMVCARAEHKSESAKEHICFKNFTGPSTAMESVALVEGSKSSLETHGLIYSKLIADGDASTYKNILKAKPYGNLMVEKIECTNHLLRNYRTKLDELTKNTSFPIKYRRLVGENIIKLQRSIKGAMKHNIDAKDKSFDEKVIDLKQDLLNAAQSNLSNVKSIKHGQEHEHIARTQLEKELGSVIEKCGLFIDKKLAFIGASPDGLIGDDKIVEIKCPYAAKDISIEDALKEKKIPFWKIDKAGNVAVNKKHDWYFQVQGQLHVTERKMCVFAVWTNVDMKIEYILRDDKFWLSEMETKLTKFYFDCLLPEIIDSRLDRNMEIREPLYILQAIKKREIESLKKGNRERASVISKSNETI